MGCGNKDTEDRVERGVLKKCCRWRLIKARPERTLNISLMSVTPEVSQPDMSALKSGKS